MSDYHRDYQRELRAERKAAHQCATCGRKLRATQNLYCEPCRERRNELNRAKARKAAERGVCVKCGKASGGRQKCTACSG